MGKRLPYLTIAAAARHIGVVHGTLNAAIRRGELSPDYTADGKQPLLRVSDVERWAKQTRPVGRKPSK